jgi:ribosomal protein S18 acetylase RimI-like enzyme
VTANISTLDKVEDIGLFDNPIRYTEVMYILTLGTRTCARRRGIASILVQKCIEIASKRTKCGAVSFIRVLPT